MCLNIDVQRGDGWTTKQNDSKKIDLWTYWWHRGMSTASWWSISFGFSLSIASYACCASIETPNNAAQISPRNGLKSDDVVTPLH